jgi:hypothetical protein
MNQNELIFDIRMKMEKEDFLKSNANVLQKIVASYHKELQRLIKENVSFNFSDLTSYNNTEIEILIDVLTSKKRPEFDGMQIIYLQKKNEKKGIFEVSEYQAGPCNENLYVYSECKSLKSAITSLLKGNHEHSKRKPIKVW